jgi:hypothetical protein
VSTLQTARFKICELFVYWAYNGNNDDNNDDNIVLFAAAIADAECNDATHYTSRAAIDTHCVPSLQAPTCMLLADETLRQV